MSGRQSRRGSRIAQAAVLVAVLGLPLSAIGASGPTSQPAPTVGASSSRTAAAAAMPVAPAVGSVPAVDGYAAATPAASEPEVIVRRSAPANGATPVTSTVNDPRCGAGFTSVATDGISPFCVHTAADPLPEIAGPLAQARTAAPVCQGNGVNGPRIQLIYMYVEGQPDRTSLIVPRIINEFAPRMEGVYRETSKLQGREIGMRLHMPGCKLAVDTVMIDADNGAPDETGAMLTRITETLANAGYDSTDRKYILWFDGGNQGACGVAPAEMILIPGGDNPTPANPNNIGFQSVLRETAVIFRYGTPRLGGPVDDVSGCWGRGGTGARTEIHELTHLLGAVQLGAPNSNGAGHCTDDHDIMCYSEQGVSTVPRCATVVEQLDCGADDYFNARPNAGSYLSTHWNTANSRFLGDSPVHDSVPAEIPRP